MKNKIEELLECLIPPIGIFTIVGLACLPAIIKCEKEQRQENYKKYEREVLIPKEELYQYCLTNGIIKDLESQLSSDIIKFLEERL